MEEALVNLLAVDYRNTMKKSAQDWVKILNSELSLEDKLQKLKEVIDCYSRSKRKLADIADLQNLASSPKLISE